MGVGRSIVTPDLHFDVLPKETLAAFQFFQKQKAILQNVWYLAGGTALALQYGHRMSVDLDFFTESTDLNFTVIENQLQKTEEWKTTFRETGTLYGIVHGAKISFIENSSFHVSDQRIVSDAVQLLLPSDIAVMKVHAITSLGSKRDFIDLYWHCVVSNNTESLESVLDRYLEQYRIDRQALVHTLKSLVYFDDAEQEPMSQMLQPLEWDVVKAFFEKKTKIIASTFL